MQEEVTERTVALSVRAVKMTGRLLQSVLRKVLAEIKKKRDNPKVHRGRQSVKKLVRQGAGVSNVEITDGNIKSFERVAKKYGVDYALKKDGTVSPPRWLVFFKGRDADALTAAFTEFTAKTVNRTKRPSVLSRLRQFKDLVKANTIDRVKHKEQERTR